MNLLVVSDLHLSPATSERNAQFLEFLETAFRNNDQVLIAGDLFDLWFGWEDLAFQFQKPIVEKMQKLFRSGLVIDYVEGNRDFGLRRLEGILFRRVSVSNLQIVWHGKKIHVEHGDLINKADRPYRIWRRASKNRFSYFLLDHLPAWITMRMALRLEENMRHTNRKHKSYYPEENMEQFLRQLGQSGVDVIIVGHFHTEKSTKMELENRIVLFYNLPGWEQGFRYLVIPPGKAAPYFTDWGKQHGNSATA